MNRGTSLTGLGGGLEEDTTYDPEAISIPAELHVVLVILYWQQKSIQYFFLSQDTYFKNQP